MAVGWLPYLALGDLRYGGRLHGLLAGGVFGGSTLVEGLCLADCGVLLAKRCRGGVVRGELYYVEGWRLGELDSKLGGFGAERVTLTVRHGPLSLHVEAHIVEDCKDAEAGGEGWARLLLALPPLQPPPIQPMAVVSVQLEGVEPCTGGRLFCPSTSGAVEAAAVDVYVEASRLDGWARSIQARLAPLPAKLQPRGFPVLVYAPLALEGKG